MTYEISEFPVGDHFSSQASHSGAPALRTVGFVGLGRMGSVMAANLASSDFGVVGFVRHAEQM